MAIIPYWLRRAVSWVVHWITRGENKQQIEQRWPSRFPDQGQEVFAQSYDEAQRSIESVDRFFTLQPADQMLLALAGEEPPSPFVAVKAVYRMDTPNQLGEWGTVIVEVPWSASVQETYAAVERAVRDSAGNYQGSVKEIVVVPPLRYPLPE